MIKIESVGIDKENRMVVVSFVYTVDEETFKSGLSFQPTIDPETVKREILSYVFQRRIEKHLAKLRELEGVELE